MVARRGIFEKVKGSGIWWIRWTDSGGQKRREKAGNRSAAEKLLAKRQTQKLEGVKLPENLRSKAVSFRELCEDALTHSRAENSERHSYELRLMINQLLPAFGPRPAEAIRKNEIVSWLAEQSVAHNWAASSRNRWQATFSLIFRVGIDNEKIERNPAARIRRKTEGHGRVRFLSDGEEARLRAAIEDRFPEFLPHLELSIHTGMRMSEQYGLRWNQVDFERRQLHLHKTKNGDPRTIPLNAVALGALNRLRGSVKAKAADPIFPSIRTGSSLQGSRGWFRTALEEAEIEGYTWHCNRHTFASRLVMAGVDLRTVAELLGHRTLQMVMRYSHLAPEHQASAVDRLVRAEKQTDTRTDTRSTGAEGSKTYYDVNVT
ncbi:MAG: site-specific integrase [Terracidiphilus sp.]|jgi:integrase